MDEHKAWHVSHDKRVTYLGPRTEEGWFRFEQLPSVTGDATNVENGPYSVNAQQLLTTLSTVNQLKREKLLQLHQKWVHAPPGIMRMVLTIKPQDGLQSQDVNLWPGKCEGCALGKPRRSTHKMKARREPKGFGTDIHTDNTATQPVKTFHGETVGNIAVDRWSNWVFGMSIKSKTRSVERLRYVTRQESKSAADQSYTIRSGRRVP